MSEVEQALKFADSITLDGQYGKVLAAEVRRLRKELNDTIRDYEKECRSAYRQGQADERYQDEEPR